MLHLYNVPSSVDPASEANPLRMVKTLYQPGDLIVIKVGNSLLSVGTLAPQSKLAVRRVQAQLAYGRYKYI